jgi:hypothetical protein
MRVPGRLVSSIGEARAGLALAFYRGERKPYCGRVEHTATMRATHRKTASLSALVSVAR